MHLSDLYLTPPVLDIKHYLENSVPLLHEKQDYANVKQEWAIEARNAFRKSSVVVLLKRFFLRFFEKNNQKTLKKSITMC